MINSRIILVSLIAISVSACSSSTPGCDDGKTKKLVLEITDTTLKSSFQNFGEMVQKMATSMGLQFDNNYEHLTLSLDDIRTKDINEKTGKIICTANLISTSGNESESVEIAYSSELANNGEKHYVQVGGFSNDKQGKLLGALAHK
ncbi:MAG: hypothetical protein FD173_420 [Gallionellaceae bacterium]|nr:MAG: hypothetical protein FD173_420 [Gallionellaceae bacterium]